MAVVEATPAEATPATAKRAASDGPRAIAILGSTGSVGCSTIDVVERYPNDYRVDALTANSNVDRLIEQCLRLKPRFAAIGNDRHYGRLKEALSGTGIAALINGSTDVCESSRPMKDKEKEDVQAKRGAPAIETKVALDGALAAQFLTALRKKLGKDVGDSVQVRVVRRLT